MSPRTVNTTLDTFFILDTISKVNTDGMTVGQVCKTQNAMTRRQVQGVLDTLEGCGFVFYEVVKYGRTGKKVYRVTENCAMLCASISRNYGENC